MLPEIVGSNESAASAACDCLVVGAFSGQAPELAEAGREVDAALDGTIAEHLEAASFKAKVGEVSVIPALGRLPARSVAVVGLGSKDRATPRELRRAAGAASRALSERPVLASTLHQAVQDEGAATAVTEGFLLGSYQFTTYKSDAHPSKIQRILFLGGEEDGIARGRARSEAAILARDLTNEPPRSLTPEILAERARDVADVSGLEYTVLDEKELADRGFGGILGVAAGSARPPRLIELLYSPANPAGNVTLIGKGVTFDSGGLSLKDAKNMETMKTDMAGAAAVISVMSALPRIDARLEVRALVPATENMPGSDAIKPGDVLVHYGKSTTEVLNTDAEGRLILGDAIAYACEKPTDAIVDVATLTGSVVVALGKSIVGLFSNDDTLADELLASASDAGEPMWRMPLFKQYDGELDSEIADRKNTGSRWGGSITAALFLNQFLEDGIPWAHLDIAGAARADSDRDEVPKGGTGVATRTLLDWIERRGR